MNTVLQMCVLNINKALTDLIQKKNKSFFDPSAWQITINYMHIKVNFHATMLLE